MNLGLNKLLVAIVIVYLSQSAAYSEKISASDTILHFDQTRTPLNSLNFDHTRELEPVANDFRIIEASYLSNNMGERWAIVTFENKSSGQRILKNNVIVATFANGLQRNSLNLGGTVQGNTRITKAVSFGVNPFPIVKLRLE